MRFSTIGALLFAVALCAVNPSRADTVAYPSPDKASFLLDYPHDWKLTPGDAEGDYLTLSGPTGVVLQFRTIPGNEEAMQAAIEDTTDYISKTYTNAKFKPVQKFEQHGLSAFGTSGTGVEEGGSNVHFAMAWMALKDGNLGEVWYVVEQGDSAGDAAAVKVMNSMRAP